MREKLAIVLMLASPAACTSTTAGGAPEGDTPPTDAPPEDEQGPQETPPSSFDCANEPEKCFVRVQDGQFVLAGKPYRYMGTNFWAAPYVGDDRLKNELDLLQEHGVRNLRILALSEGGIPGSQINDPQFGPQRITPASSDVECADDALNASIARLKVVLDEMHSRGMKAVLTLNNWYHWSGGMAQYMKWAYEKPGAGCGKSYEKYVIDGITDPETGASLLADAHHVPFSASRLFSPGPGAACQAAPVGDFVIPHPNTLDPTSPDWGKAWDDLQDLSTLFLCNKTAQEFFFSRAEAMIAALKDHPGIMAWQLANEPRSFRGWSALFRRWVERTTRFIKDIDPNHMVSIGAEGELYMWGDYANSDYREFHDLPGIDYLTLHVWPENWGWYDPATALDATGPKSLNDAIRLSDEFIERHIEHAAALKKPLVAEEFGLARDDKSSPVSSPVERRNLYYDSLFGHVSENPEFGGVNFWAWAGAGRPADDGNYFWRLGNDYLGDPPHEQQGWYSVYSSDTLTLGLIKEYASEINTSP